MPCGGDHRFDPNVQEPSALDKYVDMLCRTLKRLEKTNEFELLDSDIKNWWHYHKIWDEKNRRNRK